MTFQEMTKGLAKEFKGSIKRTGAMLQLAGIVQGLASAVGLETDAAIGEIRRARVRVYMPKAGRAAKEAAERLAQPWTKRAKKDSDVEVVTAFLEEKESAARARAEVVAKLSGLSEFAKASKEEQAQLISQALASRRAKAQAESLRLKKAEEAVKKREEGVRAEFKARFVRPAAVGKTERFEAYVAELTEAVNKETKAYADAGIAYGGKLQRELAKAVKTGEIPESAVEREGLLGKLSTSMEQAKADVKQLNEDLSVQLLGPFSGMFKTVKGFLVTSLKHFTIDKLRKREDEGKKNWLSGLMDNRAVLAEVSHLRKEGREIPMLLRLQAMLSSVLNGLMATMSAALQGLSSLTADAIGVAVAVALAAGFGVAVGERLYPHFPKFLKPATKQEEARQKHIQERESRIRLGQATREDLLELRAEDALRFANKPGYAGAKAFLAEQQGTWGEFLPGAEKRKYGYAPEDQPRAKEIAAKEKPGLFDLLWLMRHTPYPRAPESEAWVKSVAGVEDSLKAMNDAARARLDSVAADVPASANLYIMNQQQDEDASKKTASELLFESSNKDDVFASESVW